MKYVIILSCCMAVLSVYSFSDRTRIHDVSDLNYGQLTIDLSAETQSYKDTVQRLIDRG